MPERRPGHEYQLAFDLTQRPESSPPDQIVRAGTPANFDSREPHLGRFIRSVNHDVQIQSPATAAQFLMQQVFTPFEDFPQEELVALMLNMKNKITHTALIYRGTIGGVFVRNAEIYRPAILANARSIMLAHNHPSGDPSPSPEDVRFRKRVWRRDGSWISNSWITSWWATAAGCRCVSASLGSRSKLTGEDQTSMDCAGTLSRTGARWAERPVCG